MAVASLVVNSNQEFSQNIRNFFQMLDDLRDEASKTYYQAKQQTTTGECPAISSGEAKESLKSAYCDAKELISQFSGRSPDNLINYMHDFAKQLKNDKEMNAWRDDVRNLFNDVMNKPEMVDEYELTQRVEELIDRARHVFQNGEWRESYNKVITEARLIFEGIKNDPDVQQLGDKVQQFVENFTYQDNNGERHFNTDLMEQMRGYIVPLLLAQLENIPIPQISGSNPDVDWRVENLVFSGYDIIPDHVQIQLRSDVDFNVQKLEADKTYTRALISIKNIRVKLHDVHFWFKRKTMPRLHDEGIANLECAGEGANLQILLRVQGGWQRPSFNVMRVNCDIDKLNIDIKEAQHKFLLNMASTFYEAKWKREIENKVEENIKTAFGKIEKALSELMEKYPPKELPGMIKNQFKSMSDKIKPDTQSDQHMTGTSDKITPKHQYEQQQQKMSYDPMRADDPLTKQDRPFAH